MDLPLILGTVGCEKDKGEAMRASLMALTSMSVLMVLAACGPENQVDQETRLRAARSDSVGMAEGEYDASVFDTIVWPSAAERLTRGGVVWQFSCQKCHGRDGAGGGEMAVEQGIDAPSLVEADWAYSGQADSLRHRIFVGYAGEMPNWGLHGLKYRDIDAATSYIMVALRGEPLDEP